MNSDLEQFSEERLKQLASGKYAGTGLGIQNREVAPLARIALAVMQAKPVGYFRKMPNDSYYQLSKSTVAMDQIPLYTTPQPDHTDQANFYIVLNDGQPYDVFSDKDKADLYAADASGLFTVLPVFTARQPFEAPRGWKLVPEIPDAQMLRAWKDANYNNASLEGAFNKMVNAAPKPESE